MIPGASLSGPNSMSPLVSSVGMTRLPGKRLGKPQGLNIVIMLRGPRCNMVAVLFNGLSPLFACLWQSRIETVTPPITSAILAVDLYSGPLALLLT